MPARAFVHFDDSRYKSGGMEVAYLAIALLAAGTFLYLVRRASDKHSSESARSVRKRLASQKTRETEERETGQEQPDSERSRDERSGEFPDTEDDEELEDDAEEDDEYREDDEELDEPADKDETRAARKAALKRGLSRTRSGFVARLSRLFGRKQIDQDLLDELEEVLLTADIGPATANKLFESIKGALSRDELSDPDAVWDWIRRESQRILEVDATPLTFSGHKPFVLLVVGVNGVGKTTTIGKLAAKLTAQGKTVLLGAGDTFRAAAVEQLQKWGQRAHATVIASKKGSDPSSVIFDTIQRGVEEQCDVVICDTAGRLHTKKDLMAELEKVGRVCNKALQGAPHETFLVLDSTNGQNAIQQAAIFKEAMDITGIVLTKLDGTAKGGVILGICDELQVPVRFVGIGEQVDDLREFDAETFISALYEHADTEAA